MKTGTLYLIPTNLSTPFAPTQILPAAVVATAIRLNYFVAENAKTARAFLKGIGVDRPLLEITIRELNSQTKDGALNEMIAPLLVGHDVGLVSEAGAPGVADPGARVVALAHLHGIAVVPLVGPSSILLGLMASGLNGQRFAFHGYLPTEKTARAECHRGTGTRIAPAQHDPAVYRNALPQSSPMVGPHRHACAFDPTLPRARPDRGTRICEDAARQRVAKTAAVN